MGDLSKNGAGQLYVDARLIPGENMIDFISNMNNSRMMTISHPWQFNNNLMHILLIIYVPSTTKMIIILWTSCLTLILNF